MTNPNHTDTSRSGDLVKECRLDAKAFRENTVYDSDGDPIRLIANADRLDQYADLIETQAREIERMREALREVFEEWAGSEGFIPETAPEGYLLQLTKRMADIARAALGNSHD